MVVVAVATVVFSGVLECAFPAGELTEPGAVEEITTEGARKHIDELSRRYTGGDYSNPIETERVILAIRPEHVTTYGN